MQYLAPMQPAGGPTLAPMVQRVQYVPTTSLVAAPVSTQQPGVASYWVPVPANPTAAHAIPAVPSAGQESLSTPPRATSTKQHSVPTNAAHQEALQQAFLAAAQPTPKSATKPNSEWYKPPPLNAWEER